MAIRHLLSIADLELRDLLHLIERFVAFGTGRAAGDPLVLVAHSGSLLAFILDPSRPDHEARYERVLRYVADLDSQPWMDLGNYEEEIR
jgi:uncharacterized protein involved in propanediol utilization